MLRKSRVAEAQKVSNSSSFPEPQSRVHSIYCNPLLPGHVLPHPPRDQKALLGLDSIRNTDDWNGVCSVGRCAQCWIWMVRPSATPKQLLLSLSQRNQTNPTRRLQLCHWRWNPDSALFSFLLFPSLPSPPFYLGQETGASSCEGRCPKACP